MKKSLPYQNRFWKPVLMATVVAGLLTGCDRNATDPTPVSKPVELETVMGSTYEEQLESIGEALARSLADASMRQLIKTEAGRRIDGDYNVLYSTISDKMVSGQTVTQTLSTVQAKSAGARVGSIGSLTQRLPLLNVAVPVNIKRWDVSQFTPMVVVLTDNDETKPLKAFDKDGNVHWLDPKKAPSFPVVVIGESERYVLSALGRPEIKKGLLKMGSGRAASIEDEQLPDYGDNPGGEDPNPAPTNNDCSDMSKLNLSLTGWYTGDLSVIESWARGTPEIRMRAFAITQNQTKVDVYGDPVRGNLWEPNHRDDVNGRWWNLNDYLFYWNTNSYGDEVTFVLHEEDGGSPRDISIPISYKKSGIEVSTNITFRVDDGDDYIGYFPRRLPFCSGATIGNQTLKFKVRRD